MTSIDRNAVAAIDINAIKSVYSGRPGCCCGCRGTHREDEKAKARMLRTLATKDGELEMGDGYVCLDTPTRRYIAYFA